MSFKARDGSLVPDVQTWRQHLLSTQAQTFKRVFGAEMAEHFSVVSGLNLRSLGITSKAYTSLWYKDIAAQYGEAGVALVEALTTHPKKLDANNGEQSPTQRATGRQPQAPPAQASAPFAVMFDAPPPISVPDVPRGPTTPLEARGTSLTGLGAMFAETPAQIEEEEPEDEAPPTNGIASLFS